MEGQFKGSEISPIKTEPRTSQNHLGHHGEMSIADPYQATVGTS